MNKFNLYNIVPFNGENYSAWSFRLKSVLKENGLEKAIEDEDFSTEAGNTQKESKAQAITISCISDSHLEYIKNRNTAYAMMKNLEESFEKKCI